jgi:hypothetical protein
VRLERKSSSVSEVTWKLKLKTGTTAGHYSVELHIILTSNDQLLMNCVME